MLNCAKLKAILVPLTLLAAGAVPAAAQQDAVPADRCEGTLCDLYYGGAPAAPQPDAKTAAPRPIMVPQGGILGMFSGGSAQQAGASGTAQPARRPMVGVGGGGLAAMARGEKQERCTGTLCDLYYGGPPPEPSPEQAGAQPAAQSATSAPQTAEATPDAYPDEPPRSPRTRAADSGVRYAAPRCYNAQDPWKCYR